MYVQPSPKVTLFPIMAHDDDAMKDSNHICYLGNDISVQS